MIYGAILTNLTLVYLYILSVTSLSDSYTLNLLIKDVQPLRDDQYFCQSFPVPHSNRESFISSFESNTNDSKVHHMILFGCRRSYASVDTINSCHKICIDRSDQIVYSWAKNGEKFELPDDTGMAIGGKSGINYLVLQIHFLKKFNRKESVGLIAKANLNAPTYLSGMMTFFSYYGFIPPNKNKATLDISCKYKGPYVYPLAIRAHTHDLGRSVTAYRVSSDSGDIFELGKLNPQWPQNFYKSKSSRLMIHWGDILMVRCLYDSSGHSKTNIGMKHSDEMCNLYIMIVTRNRGRYDNYFSCGGNEFKDLWKNVPKRSMEYSPKEIPMKVLPKKYKFQNDWSIPYKFGDVSGVSVLPHDPGHTDSLLVLHRANVHWKQNTFREHVFTGDKIHDQISDPIIIQVDPNTGSIIGKIKPNYSFYMPHSITVTDDSRYLWISDVALHQVVRFVIIGRDKNGALQLAHKPDLVIGERFVPGNDEKHLCKPTKVVEDQEGNILIADGYCNSRVICYYKNGTFADEWRPGSELGPMFIVHSLTIVTDKLSKRDVTHNTVWVADRENRRLLAFTYDGKLRANYQRIQQSIFAIQYNKYDNMVYGVTSEGDTEGSTFSLNPDTLDLGSSWIQNSKILKSPHDLVIAQNGTLIFVAEIYQQKIFKFQLEGSQNQLSSSDSDASIQFQAIVDKVNPTYMGASMLGGLLFVIICIILIKLMRRFRRRRKPGRPIPSLSTNNKYNNRRRNKKRYSKLLGKDNHEGFEPLNQEEPDDEEDGNDAEDDDDDGNRHMTSNGLDSTMTTTIITGDLSDPETEEFNAASHLARHMKKPTV